MSALVRRARYAPDEPATCLARPDASDADAATALVHDVLAGADDRSVLLITHRPDGLELVDEVVRLA